jgi:hypothetical protein
LGSCGICSVFLFVEYFIYMGRLTFIKTWYK